MRAQPGERGPERAGGAGGRLRSSAAPDPARRGPLQPEVYEPQEDGAGLLARAALTREHLEAQVEWWSIGGNIVGCDPELDWRESVDFALVAWELADHSPELMISLHQYEGKVDELVLPRSGSCAIS